MKNKLISFILAVFALSIFSSYVFAQDAVATKVPFVCTPPPNTTMVAWYPFDDKLPVTSNLATGNSGTLSGPTYIAGKVSNALQFDGINDYVDSPSTIVTNFGPAGTAAFGSGLYSTSQGDFTIDAWIKSASPQGVVTIVDKRSNTPLIGYHFWLWGNKLGLQLADSSGYDNLASPNLVFNDNQWHHIAVTVKRTSATGITWFLDGAVVGTSNPTNRKGSLVNNSVLRIGARTAASPLSGFYKGAIDELEIFNRALEPGEIKKIFAAGSFGKCKK
jgi:hypothetical protein